MELLARWSCGFDGLGWFVQATWESVQVGAGEAPVERHGGLLVAALEAKQPLLDLDQVGEVVGGQDLALDDGEADLDLVEPGGVDAPADCSPSRQ
jgi:hypothetical protein